MSSFTNEDYPEVRSLVGKYNAESFRFGTSSDEDVQIEAAVGIEDAALDLALVLFNYVPEDLILQVREMLAHNDNLPSAESALGKSGMRRSLQKVVEKIWEKMLP